MIPSAPLPRRVREQPLPAVPARAPAPAPVPAVAERPDAAPRRADNVLRAALHAVVLLSVVGFVVAYCVVIPVRRQFNGRVESATAMLVADVLIEVRCPDVTGVFHATRPLPHGARVRKGELLGQIEAPRLEDDIARESLELRGLQVRLLRLDQRSAAGELTTQEAQETRDLAGRVEVVTQSLKRLHAVRSQLAVYASADGVIQLGLAATVAAAPHQAIVSFYPDGGSLLVEVSAPLDVLGRLQRSGRITAVFATVEGSAEVVARPLSTTVRHFTKKAEGGREETWGMVQCIPESLPADLRAPGLIGSLGS